VLKAIITSVLSGFIVSLLIYTVYVSKPIDWSIALGVTAIGTVIVLVFLIFYGLPVHWLMRKYQKTNFGYYALVGFIPSLYTPLDHYFGIHHTSPVNDTIMFAILGIAVSLSFKYSYEYKAA
jgi:hypothetical protein